MNKKPKAIIALVLTVLTVALLIWTCFYAGGKYVVFDPKGPIGQAQKELIILSTSMAALLIVPVMILTFSSFGVIATHRITRRSTNPTGTTVKNWRPYGGVFQLLSS